MATPDLNLLVTLDVLLAEGSVARAAQRLRLSPSAMSRALSRLRATMGDPLLVRAGRGLVPTPWALELASGSVSSAGREAVCGRRRSTKRLSEHSRSDRDGFVRISTGPHCPVGEGVRRARRLAEKTARRCAMEPSIWKRALSGRKPARKSVRKACFATVSSASCA
jgi:hypothetical protein